MLRNLRQAVSVYRGLPRDIYFIALARLILGTGNFILIFLVLLLTEKLGYSATAAGTLAMTMTAILLAGNAAGGKLADLFGHKNIMVAGELAGSVILIVCGFYSEAPVLIPVLLLIAYFLFGMAFPASNALVADLSAPKNRDAVLSLSYLAFNLGSAVGPVIAGYLFWHHTEWIFFGNGIASLAGIMIVICFVRQTDLPQVNEENQNPQDQDEPLSPLEAPVSGTVWSVLKARPRLLVFTLFSGLLWFAQNQMTVANPLYINHLFGTDGPVIFGHLMAYACVFVVLSTPLLLKMTTGKTEPLSLTFAGLLLALGYGLIVWQPTVAMHFFAWSLLAAGEVLLVTKEGVYLANQSPASHRGRIQGTLTIVRGILIMPGFSLIGWIIDRYGYSMMWQVVIISSLTATVGLWVLDRQQKKHQLPAATV